jgi:hypothetical protein
MGCCRRTAEPPAGAVAKFRKDSEATDVRNGPVKNRRCTDILCILLYILNWFVFLFVTLYGVQDGSPTKLYRPRDFKGEYCGLDQDQQYLRDRNLESFEKVSYMMNVSHAVDRVAMQLMCSSAARGFLESELSTAQREAYLCACCLTPCATCDGSLELGGDITSAANAGSVIGPEMLDLTDISRAADLFNPAGENGDFFYNMWSQATLFFVKTCVTGCNVDYTTLNGTSNDRSYTYAPSLDSPLRNVWDLLAASEEFNSTIRSSFTFSALPSSVCPYDAGHCVPFPGVVFQELAFGYCEFEAAAQVVQAVGSSVANSWQSLGRTSLMENTSETLGQWWGDFEASIWAFVITCVCSFTIGLIFMVLFRFAVGFCVWLAVFAVFLAFGLGGLAAFFRSHQCHGTSFIATSTQAVTAAASTAENAVSNIGQAASGEGMSGDGADYRGVQARTKTGRSCEAWASTTYTSAAYPDSDLVGNFCRNPYPANATYHASTIWCFTTDPEKTWEECAPIGQILEECEHGYALDANVRHAMRIIGYVIWALGGLWVLIVLCSVRRINDAIAVNKTASLFLTANPSALIVPIVQVFVTILWCILWAVSLTFLVSQVPDNFVPNGYFATEPEAADACWGTGLFGWDLMRVDGRTWKDSTCPLEDGTAKCWRCMPPRYVLDLRVWYSFFAFLWTNAFFVAMGELVLAGAICAWFFTPNAEKSKKGHVRLGLWNACRYHVGSAAFGSLIIAIVQLVRAIMMYAERQAKAQQNKVAEYILKALVCCSWCLEKCLKYLNKNAYIQVALMGTNFCTSAWNAFTLLFRNALRFGTVAALGFVIHAIGIMFIVTATTASGYLIITNMYAEVNPTLPLLFTVVVSYIVGKLYMNVFGLGVDASLQCMIAAEEMEHDGDFVPEPLRKRLPPCKAATEE